MMLACICGGVLEVGLAVMAVSGATWVGTDCFNRFRQAAHAKRNNGCVCSTVEVSKLHGSEDEQRDAAKSPNCKTGGR